MLRMKPKPILIFPLLLLSTGIFAQDASEKPSQDSPAKTATCVVEGTVVAAATGEPLKSALVVLTNIRAYESAAQAVTDSRGHFAITDLPADSYYFRVSKHGYVEQAYHPDPAGPAEVLELEPGEKLDKVEFRLIRTAVIMGRITDESGDPIPYVRVEAQISGKKLVDDDGIPVPEGKRVPVQATWTDDLGEYRLYDLRPGSYFLMAGDTGALMHPPRGLAYSLGLGKAGGLRLYYPGVTRPDKAQKIRVKAGQEARIDLSLPSEKSVTVSGRVLDSNGKPFDTTVILHSDSGSDFAQPESARTDAQGNFAIKGVVPGSYTISATLPSVGQEPCCTSLQIQPIEVAGDDISGLELKLSRQPPPVSFSLAGKVTKAGKSPLDLHSVRVCLSMGDLQIVCAAPSKQGIFIFEDVASGAYHLQLMGLPAGWYVRSAVFGGQDVLSDAIKLADSSAGDSLKIVVSSGIAQVEGVVLRSDDPEDTVTAAVVRLIPEPVNAFRKDLLRSAKTNEAGEFIIENVAPGRYCVTAVDSEADDENSGEDDDDDSSPAAPAGRVIVLAEKEHKTLKLKIAK